MLPVVRPLARVLALAAVLCAGIAAQSLDVEVTAAGAPSGVSQTAAERMCIHAVATRGSRLEVGLTGPAGKTAGLLIGLTPLDVAVPPVRLLVDPLVVFTSTFDAGGEARFSMTLPNAPGAALHMQGLAVDMANPTALFALTWRITATIVPAEPTSLAFDRDLARTLLELAWDAYEYPGRSAMHEGARLTGGFQVLDEIESPNASSEPWFRRMGWPDTQLFLAREPGGDLAVVFRGTDFAQPRDWASDLQFGQNSGFHSGILLAYGSVQNELRSALQRLVEPDAKVLVTGHSLGAGLAPIAAFDIAPLLASLGVPQNDVVLYGFAGPRAMSPQRATELGQRVPNHFAIANKDDVVTHVPVTLGSLRYAHVPRMRVLYPRRAMIAESGSEYVSALLPPLTPGVASHHQDEYEARLREVLAAPDVALSVSGSGHMRIGWSFPQRRAFGFARDFIALYDGPPDPTNPGAHLVGAWQWASGGGAYTTNVPKGRDYHVAYVQQYSIGGEQKILATAGPYSWDPPRVWLTRDGLRAELHWSINDPGALDYVALYNRDPRTAGIAGYIVGQWQWATRGRSWTSLTPWRSGLWIAYVEKDSRLAPGRIAAVAGPY